MTTAIGSQAYWIVAAVTAALTAATIGLHYETLQQLNRRMPRWILARHPRVLVMMFCILGVHVLEISLFGVGIYAVVQSPALGAIVGTDPLRLFDALYVSATTYTTLGYGDLVPTGPVRLLLGTEALVGLLMITWSASFAYLEMQRFWRA